MRLGGAVIVGANDLREANLTLPALLSDLLSLDHKLYKGDNPLDAGTLEQWLPIFETHPETWRALVRNARVVGYWQIAPLKRQAFDAIIAGAVGVRDLRCSDYEDLHRSGRYPIYFVSVCLDENVRSAAHQFALVSSFLWVNANLAARGIVFDRVAAHAHSRDGRRLCEVLGLKPTAGDKQAQPLFIGSLNAAIGTFKGQLAERHFPPALSDGRALAT